jgi:tetratricopeptide (TPR) repeat protein
MPLSRLEIARAALVLFVLAGCSSTKPRINPPGEDDEVPINTFADDELYAGIPTDQKSLNLSDDAEFIGDADITFGNERDAEKIAQWVTQRKKMVTWCFEQTKKTADNYGEYKKVFPGTPRPEDRLDQAIAISMKVVDNVPDATRERYRLAQALFWKGSFEFYQIDMGVNAIATYQDKGDTAKATKLEKDLEPHRKRLMKYHLLALRHFRIYLDAFPNDRNTLDFIWKIQFELGNFRDAVKSMNALLDTGSVPDELRTKYEGIRKDINDYLVNYDIDKSTPKPLTPADLKAHPLQEGG